MTRVCYMLIAAAFLATAVTAAQSPPQRYGLGKPAPQELITRLDTDVRPDGTGLPPGRGTASDGAGVYARQCAACHGAKGEGGQGDVLVGAEPPGIAPFGPQYEQWRRDRPDVPFTVGNFWPYATTLFDYVRRAMPYNESKSLTNDEVYAVVAYILQLNGVVGENDTVDARTLPKVKMPNRDGFVTFARGK